MDREILRVFVMNIPKDCKQLIIEKLKYQYWQENFYLNKINLTIQLAYAREEQNRIYEELLEVELAINSLTNEQRREQAYELLIGHEYLLDEDELSENDEEGFQ